MNRRNYIISVILLGLAFVGATYGTDLLLKKYPSIWLEILKIIFEGGIVASIIGLFLEISHIKRFYDKLVRKALIDLEYLRKFGVDTLDEIFEKTYIVRNEKEITNDLHEWRQQFTHVWEYYRDIPIKPYRSNHIHRINVFFYDKKDGEKIKGKFKSIFEFDFKSLNADILIVEDIFEYDLISSSLQKSEHNLSTFDNIKKFPNLKDVEEEKFLIYSFNLDGKEIQVGKDNIKIEPLGDDRLTFTLEYKVPIGPVTHIILKIYSIEPQSDNSYLYYFEEVASDIKVYFHSNIDLKRLGYETWISPLLDDRFKEIKKTNRDVVFLYDHWVYPQNGYVIVWEK